MSGITPTFLVVNCLFLASLHHSTSGSIPKLTGPSRIGCACPGEVLSFICTVVGGTTTIWKGTAFDCPSAGNQIILRHSLFNNSQNTETLLCTDRLLVGQPLNVTGDCYVSELNATVTDKVHNKTVQCFLNSDVAVPELIGTVTIIVISGPYPPPNNIKLVSVSEGQLFFTWNSVNNNCPYFLITSDSCGTCPSSTNTASITCSTTDTQLSNNVTVCTFRVQSRICNHLSDHSSPISVRLKVPDTPELRVIPRYYNDNQSLISFRVLVQQVESFNFTDNISSNISSYSISFYNSSTNVISRTSTHPACDEDVCQYAFSMSSILCVEDFKVAVSAINQLGQGQFAKSITHGCSNNFVQVKVDASTYTITCMFLNESKNGAKKSCSVTYSLCQYGGAPRYVSTPDSTDNDTMVIKLELEMLNQTLCYTVMASTGDFTVEVEGRVDPTGPLNGMCNIVPIVVPLVLVLVLAMLVILIIFSLVWKRKHKKSSTEEVDNTAHNMECKHFKSVVRGYHAHQKHWKPVVGEVLSTKREPRNKYDRGAVAVVKSRKVVGHMPRQIAKECSIFIKQKGTIHCEITGEPQPQKITMTKNKGSLEVPCRYIFSSNNQTKLSEIAQVLQQASSSLAERVDNL